MSDSSLKKHKAPPKHSCFDPEEFPGGTKFALLKGLPPPPCYSCGQNAKTKPKSDRIDGQVHKGKKVDKSTGSGVLASGSRVPGSRKHSGEDKLSSVPSGLPGLRPGSELGSSAKPGTTLAGDEGPGPTGDFLKMLSFLVGIAAGYGLSSMLCRLNRCKVLTIMRNLRDVGAFLCSERCGGP